jgi:phospholipase/lecithinase/hemolysin
MRNAYPRENDFSVHTKSMNNTPHIARVAAGMFIGWRTLAFCLLTLTAATVAFAGAQFSSIVVFGDSISDTGRLFQLTNGGFPPSVAYYNGRESNGPVWVEYLASHMGLDHQVKNYAVIGAMSGPSAAVPSGNVWSDTFTGLEGTSLLGQLSRYFADTGGTVDPEALYIVQGGANDLISPLTALLLNPPATVDEFLQDVQIIATPTVINIATIAGTLKALGAQHIAIVNVPDFGKTPRLYAFGPVASATVSMVVQLVNEAVDTQLDGLDGLGGNKLVHIDMYGFIDGIATEPARFGFKNVTGQFMTLNPVSLTVTYANPRPHAASQWFFWDDLHPTTRGHEAFAQSAFVTLRAASPIAHEVSLR